jgi:hypothetical protein
MSWLVYYNATRPFVGLSATLMESMHIGGQAPRLYPDCGDKVLIVDHSDVRVPAELIETSLARIVIGDRDGREITLTPRQHGDMPPSHSTTMPHTNWTIREVKEPQARPGA